MKHLELSDKQKARIKARWLKTRRLSPATEAVGPKFRPLARAYLAGIRAGEKEPPKPFVGGQVVASSPAPVERKGEGVQRFLLTACQNNTHLHEPTWENLKALAAHYDATILVGRIMYDTMVNHRLHKPGHEPDAKSKEVWFDPRIDPFVADCDLQLCPSLVWLGSMNTIPTARHPLASLEGVGRGASAVVPHTQVAMDSLPRMMSEPPRFNFSTGAVSQINYIARKAGRLAEFHHSYGALLVEVEGDDTWWARQVLADSDGVLCDRDLMVLQGKVVEAKYADTLTTGDLHEVRADRDALKAVEAIAKELNPGNVVLHDVLDFQAQSHHLKHKPVVRNRLRLADDDWVQGELHDAAALLHSWSERRLLVVVDSNHDRHLGRWLDEVDWRDDLVNAKEILRWNLARLEAKPGFHLFEHVMRENYPLKNVRFLRLGESWKVAGVEHGLHGDIGINGARGGPAAYAKAGARVTVGHSHSPSIHQGVYTVGTTSKLDMGYNRGGLTRWAHAHCVLYRNGKRALICPRGGRPWA